MESLRTDSSPPTSHLFGLEVSALGAAKTVDFLIDRATRGVRTNVAALNAGKVVSLRRDERLRKALQAADLIIADGQSVVWASRALGAPIRERVTGIDLFEATLRAAEQKGLSVYFLGGEEQILGKAVTEVRKRHPRLKVAGFHHGYFKPEEEALISRTINKSGARLLYVAMSSPRKETWAADNIDELGVPVVMGVGGSIDILSGATRRAPPWMRRLGLEWLFRLVQEPRRMWRRYLIGNLVFLGITFREAVISRRKPKTGG